MKERRLYTKAERVLRLLVQGQELEIDGYTWLIRDGRLCIKACRKPGDGGLVEDVLLSATLDFNAFLRLAETAEEEALVGAVMGLACMSDRARTNRASLAGVV